ncbi:MAG: growth inhibitor PemK [Erythrobacter sp.]|nr:growth inhibitor PemK [Erythrobacter sp.]
MTRLWGISAALPNGQAKLIARRSIITDAQFRAGDVVWVPFPFVEVPRLRDRPAVVVSVQQPAERIRLLWVIMVTSAVNKGWEGDVSLESRHSECGLNVPCVIRCAKIATIEAARVSKAGRLPEDIFDKVRAAMSQHLR